MIGMPVMEVNFKQLANSLVQRSERGVGILIIKDDTNTLFNFKKYSNALQFLKDKKNFTSENFQYINDVFAFSLAEVFVVKIAKEGDVLNAFDVISKNIKTGWITIADGTAEDFEKLATWIKAQENLKKSYKAVVHKVKSPDSKHVVNFMNEKVEFDDKRGLVDGAAYTPSLIGILASCNVSRGATSFVCKNLKSVEEVADRDGTLQSGGFILVNDVDKVRVGLGVNSLINLENGNTEDMKFIDIIEAMDLIFDDLYNVFFNDFCGGHRNKLDDQVLFISAVRTYFKELEKLNILDDEYNNTIDIDVEAQREVWIATGKVEAEKWDTAKIRGMAFKRSAFLIGDIKILGTMENMKINLNMA